jgi:SAM-dependent methyltransferase
MHLTSADLIWEETPCDWCGSEQSTLHFEGPDRLEKLPGSFRLVRCSQCGLYRQNPRLAWDSLQYYYPEDYASHAKLVKHEQGALRQLDKRYGPWKRLRAVERFQPGGHMLEVGCGTGQFLEEALRSGHWQVTGVEPSPHAASYTREALQIPVIQEQFSHADLPESTFDAVVFWNVFEHLYHPIADLRKARRLLKPGGWVVIGLPNIESWEQRLFKQYWVGWDQPRHLYLFPQKTLRSILETEGFERVSTRCISTSYSVLYYSLDFWSQTWAERHPGLRQAMLRLYRTWLVRALLVPPLWVSDRLKLSTVITFFGQKSTPPPGAS